MFTVRMARIEDLTQVGALLKRSYPNLMAADYDPTVLGLALPRMVTANPSLLASGRYYLAVTEGDNRVIGCGGWTRERPGAANAPIEPHIGHVRHFATDPEWVRRGVGRALIERSVHAAREVGVSRFECFSSLSARSFYTAQGFVVLRMIEVPLGPDVRFPSILMEREPL